MEAMQLIWTALLLLVQEPTDWATGRAFEKAVRREPVSITWEQVPLRPQLDALARNQRVAILLDRRIDPGQRVDFRSRDFNLEQFLWQLAEPRKLGVTQVGNILYLGPCETALALSQQERRWSQLVADPKLPKSLRERLRETVRLRVAEPFEPTAWLAADANRARLEIGNPDQLPFDLWGPIDWPDLPRYQVYLMLLAGFGLGLELDSDSLRLVALNLADPVQCEFSLEGLDGAVAAQLSREFPLLKFEVTGKILKSTGKPADQTQLQRQLALLRMPLREAAGTQVFTLRTSAPRGSILATIAQQLGVKLQFPDDARPLLSKQIEVDVQRVSAEQLILETLRDSGLVYRLENGVLQLERKRP